MLVQADAEDGRLFEWHDGPLVLAMREGGVFLMDEISLADDSVLERLNRYTHPDYVPISALVYCLESLPNTSLHSEWYTSCGYGNRAAFSQ